MQGYIVYTVIAIRNPNAFRVLYCHTYSQSSSCHVLHKTTIAVNIYIVEHGYQEGRRVHVVSP